MLFLAEVEERCYMAALANLSIVARLLGKTEDAVVIGLAVDGECLLIRGVVASVASFFIVIATACR